MDEEIERFWEEEVRESLKPREGEWVPVSAVLMEKEGGEIEVVSFGAGSKCLG